jgi:DNA-binding PadR family transcriptional regulator
MARQNQTQTAVLGALSVRPMTGYALREAIRDVLGYFWSESFGQIYPALAELERGGYVERRDSARPGASMFAITPPGTARLKERLSQPVQPVPPRNGLMLRLFFGRQLGPQACRALLLEARADAEGRLAQYLSLRQELIEEQEDPEDRPYWLLTVSAGEHTARAAIAWADEALAALGELEQARGQSRPPKEGTMK